MTKQTKGIGIRKKDGNVLKNLNDQIKKTECDACISCFEKKTIQHQLLECPCTQEVWRHLEAETND
jgi:hypothetical protein